MKHLLPLLLIAQFPTDISAGELPRPRGVGPKFAKFFKSEKTFTCISNPTISIKTSQINDDFCDCPDGSDEPGTAACTLMSAPSVLQLPLATSHNFTPALPGFYCKNKGHFPAYLPNTHVNDGVCDYDTCCDGGDEWVGVGGVKCADRCEEIGREWKRLDEIKQSCLRAALKKRSDLVAAAHVLRTNVEKDIANLKQEIKVLEEKTIETKSKYEDLQREERRRLVSNAGKNSDVSELVSLAKKRLNQVRHALIVVISRRDVLHSRVQELELILSTFKEQYNPNFNDEGVKRAVKAWEDYEAAKTPDQADALEDEDKELAEALTEDGKDYGIDWEKWTVEESNAGTVAQSSQLLPSSIHNWLRDKILDVHIMLVENGLLPGKSAIDSESRVVTEAREHFQSVSDDLQNKLTTVGKYEADLQQDYGVNDIFRALKGQCIEKDSGEYIYELCWLEGAKQKSKKGGGNTGMGQFVRFDHIDIDEEPRPDGKSLGTGKHLSLRYENGHNCWNGPSRETTIVLGCAEENEIWRIVELEKCIYRMDVGTPAVCESSKPRNKESTL